jgi:hypothetical protein
MRTITKAAILAVALSVPMAAFAAQAAAPTKKSAAASTKKEKAPAVMSHTTSGTVKSSSDTSLVVTKGGKDQTFVVNASTKKDGALDTGAKVTVAYTMDGKDKVATSVKASAAKPAAAKKGKK